MTIFRIEIGRWIGIVAWPMIIRPSTLEITTICEVSLQRFLINGFQIYRGYLSPQEQERMVSDLREVIASAPMFSPVIPSGGQMSVKMSAAGDFGWYSDHAGYRYEKRHPGGQPWESIPKSFLAVWRDLAKCEREPECCLINYYDKDAHMGLHQDNNEANNDLPVVSITLGDAGLFRMGTNQKGGATKTFWLESGDVCVFEGAARLAYHGIDRIRFGSSKLLRQGGRLNLTLRVVT